MAITFRAAGTVGTAATTSVSLSQPTGTTTGDLLLAFVIDHATAGRVRPQPDGPDKAGRQEQAADFRSSPPLLAQAD